MTPSFRPRSQRTGALALGGVLAIAIVGATAPGLAADSSPQPSGVAGAADAACAPAPAEAAVGASPAPSLPGSRSAASPEQETPGPAPAGPTVEPGGDEGSASGDVPDNAVFLTYDDASLGFSIQYVEGWQVTPGPEGVVMRDKDSSETVRILPLPADLTACVTQSELPALQAMPDFSFIGQDLVAVNGRDLIHLSYHLLAPPDPVTDKRVSSTVDRYYVPGPTSLAVVSLSTPDGVDNVDAFRQMIESLTWS